MQDDEADSICFFAPSVFSAFTVLAGSLLHKQLDNRSAQMPQLFVPVFDVPERSKRIQACQECLELLRQLGHATSAAAGCWETAQKVFDGIKQLESCTQDPAAASSQVQLIGGDAGDLEQIYDISSLLDSEWIDSLLHPDMGANPDAMWGLHWDRIGRLDGQ